jgi:hypothetical protein
VTDEAKSTSLVAWACTLIGGLNLVLAAYHVCDFVEYASLLSWTAIVGFCGLIAFEFVFGGFFAFAGILTFRDLRDEKNSDQDTT